jgi:hypothetical protein
MSEYWFKSQNAYSFGVYARAMKKNRTLFLIVSAIAATALWFSNTSARGATQYVRAREFSMRFANVISTRDEITFTIGREDDPTAIRLRVKAGSNIGYTINPVTKVTRRVTFSRGVKVDTRGLLLPIEALSSLGCVSMTAITPTTLRASCDGKTYNLQHYAR